MIRIPALQASAVLVPVAAMLYWLWRIRNKQPLRGPAGVGGPVAAVVEKRVSLP
jgi:hypothetical protein